EFNFSPAAAAGALLRSLEKQLWRGSPFMLRKMWMLFVLESILVAHAGLQAQEGKEPVKLKGHDGYVRSLAFSSDGKTLVSCGGEQFKHGEIRLWDISKGEEKGRIKGHASHICKVVFTSDDRTLVSASDDKTIKLWDVAAHKEIATLRGHTDRIW